MIDESIIECIIAASDHPVNGVGTDAPMDET
jgi:hypothetical protein